MTSTVEKKNIDKNESDSNNLPLFHLLPRDHQLQQQQVEATTTTKTTTRKMRKHDVSFSSKNKGENNSSGKRNDEDEQKLLKDDNDDEEEIGADVLCPGCRYDSFLDPSKRGGATCFSRIVERMDEKQQQKQQQQQEQQQQQGKDTTILIEAAIMVAEEFPDVCGVCDPKSCGLPGLEQQQQQEEEKQQHTNQDENEQQRRRRRSLYYRVDQAAPPIIDARVHFLQSLSWNASRLPPSALKNLTAYFANPQHQYPHRHYYFEFNPSIAVLPRSQIPKSLASKDPVYIAVYRVSNHHNCVTGANYLNMMGGGRWDRVPADQSFLAVALLNAELEILEETVVEVRKKFQDPRIFSLPTTTTNTQTTSRNDGSDNNNNNDDDNLQLYLASYRILVPLWLNQPSSDIIDRNRINRLRSARWLLNSDRRASSKVEIWLRTDAACTQDRFTWLVGKNLNYFVVPSPPPPPPSSLSLYTDDGDHAGATSTTTTTTTAATYENRTRTTAASSVSSLSSAVMNIIMEVEPMGPKEYINISRSCPDDVVSSKKLQKQNQQQQQQQQQDEEEEELQQSTKDDAMSNNNKNNDRRRSYFIYPPNYSFLGEKEGGGGETAGAAAKQLPHPTYSTSDELIFAQRRIVERPYTLERGGACCVRILDPRNGNNSDSSLLLGIAHVKTKYKFKKENRPTTGDEKTMTSLSSSSSSSFSAKTTTTTTTTKRSDTTIATTLAAEENVPGDNNTNGIESNHFFSLFYAMESKAPFATVARTGRFCFGFPSREEITRSGSPYHQGASVHDTLGTGILVVGRHTYPNCPRIHFVSGMIEKVNDPTKLIITYGVNDCISRFVTVRKEDVIEMLFSDSS